MNGKKELVKKERVCTMRKTEHTQTSIKKNGNNKNNYHEKQRLRWLCSEDLKANSYFFFLATACISMYVCERVRLWCPLSDCSTEFDCFDFEWVGILIALQSTSIWYSSWCSNLCTMLCLYLHSCSLCLVRDRYRARALALFLTRNYLCFSVAWAL